MKNVFLKKITFFFSSVFIFLLHLPFVFAKSKLSLMPEDPKQKIQHVLPDTDLMQPPMQTIQKAGIYDSLKLGSMGLAQHVFDYAMRGFNFMQETGTITNNNIISIIDFTKPSFQKRLFIIDLKNYKVLFNTYVAHGMNSGAAFASHFSNVPESNQSSLGFYVTSATYEGKHGYSLHLEGVEKGINDNANRRDIVMHAADYVSESFIRSRGYIGRSLGCPAIPEPLHRPVINKIKNGTCLFIYGADKKYISHSKILNNNYASALAMNN